MPSNSEEESLPFRVIVKLDEPAEPLAEGQTPQSWVRARLGASAPVPDRLGVRPLFRQASEIRFFHQLANNRDRAYQDDPPRLLHYAALDCATVADAQTLKAAFGASAYLQVGAGFSSQTAPAPLGMIDQGYLESAPRGVNARFAWDFPGGNGLGLRFVDVERGWFLAHEDLVDSRITLISGENIPADQSHGTSVLGIIAALNNRVGPIGIAHGLASARLVSIRLERDLDSTVEAIVTAILELRFGDVLLIEVQIDDGSAGHRPVEIEKAVFDAIRFATALGVVVIEPAGNGGGIGQAQGDLDSADRLNRQRQDFCDSGAILVGAAGKDVPHQRAASSNFGSRIDCYAWGERIGTTVRIQEARLRQLQDLMWGGWWIGKETFEGIVPATDLISQQGFFDGTSGASAILAGVALSVQGLAQAHLGFRLSPWQLRLLLSDPENGTASANRDDRIGVMPDLRRIIRRVLMIAPRKSPWAEIDRSLERPKASGGSPVPEAVERSQDLDLLRFSIKVPAGLQMTRLEVVSRLPRKARVWLEMPPEIADLEGIWGGPRVDRMSPENIFVPVNPYGKSYFREIRTNAAAEVAHELRLVIRIPPVRQVRRFQIEVLQFGQALGEQSSSPWGGVEVGSVTWPVIREPGQASRRRRASG